MINCVIIEDEPLAQIGLQALIKPYNNFNILEVCNDTAEFLQFLETTKQPIDLLFLDIELPDLNGTDFLRKAQLNIPAIFTTAYNQYALEGFELNALDYLLKPISKERFGQTIQKAENYLQYLNSKSDERYDYIYIKSEKVIEKVFFNEIVLVEAMLNYVIYHCEKRKLICYSSLKKIEMSLPAEQFIRIQKSFIINKNKVQKIEKGHVLIHNKTIALKRGDKTEIIKRLTQGLKI